MNTKNTNALHELQWRTENRKKKQTTPAKKEITIDKNTAKHTLSENFTPKRAELKLTQLQENFMYTDAHPSLRNLNKHRRADNYEHQRSTNTNPEDSCKLRHNTKQRAHYSLGFLHGQSGRGTRSGRNTQSRTKGSYIHDVESCHIRTLAIHL